MSATEGFHCILSDFLFAGGDSESGDEPEETATRVSRSQKANRKRQWLEEDGEPCDTDISEKILKWKQLGGTSDDKMGKSGEPTKKVKKKKKSKIQGLEDENDVISSGREGGVKKGILRASASKAGGAPSGPSPKRVRFSLQGLPAEVSSDTTTEEEFSDLIDPDLDLDIDFDHDFDAEGELDMDEIQSGSDTETDSETSDIDGKTSSLP